MWAGIADSGRSGGSGATRREDPRPRGSDARRHRLPGGRSHASRTRRRSTAGSSTPAGSPTRSRGVDGPVLAVYLREAVASACRSILDEAARAVGLPSVRRRAVGWTAPGGTSSSFCSSTASSPRWPAPEGGHPGPGRSLRRERLGRDYFENLYERVLRSLGLRDRPPTSAGSTSVPCSDRRPQISAGARGRLLHRGFHRDARAPLRRAAGRGRLGEGRRHRQRDAWRPASNVRVAASHAAGGDARTDRSTSSSPRRSSTTGRARSCSRRCSDSRARSHRRLASRGALAQGDEDLPASGRRGARTAARRTRASRTR